MNLLIGMIAGLLIGSFLNVCIYRWPRDLSVVAPRSRCPGCETPIAGYDNIPLLSYLLLRGKCRNCAAPIPWRYPAVEILTAALFALIFADTGLTLLTARNCLFAAIQIGLVFSDFETRLLPDEMTLGGLAAGLAFAFVVPVKDSMFQTMAGIAGFHPGPMMASVGEALLGAILPTALLWLMGWLFEKIRNKEGLGFGDVKMIAMVGAFLGLSGSLATLVIGSLLGSVIGLAWLKITKNDPDTYHLPLASFLGAAALIMLLAGDPVLGWYGRLGT